MKKIGYSVRNNSMTVVVGDQVYTVARDHVNWNKIIKAINDGQADLIAQLMDIPTALTNYFVGKVSVVDGVIKYNNQRIGGVIETRILEFMNQGLPVVPMLRFLEKLMLNPSKRAVEELYTFLEHKNMPITTEGNFLAYKGLRSDYWSISGNKNTVVLKGQVDDQGHIFNGIGEEIEVARNSVNDNKEHGCAEGLHAGSLEYAKGFAQGKMVIVEINPADVVSIPTDCSCQKLRTCKYKVIEEFVNPLADTYHKTSDDEGYDDYYNDDCDEDDGCDCCGCDDCDSGDSEDYRRGYIDGFNGDIDGDADEFSEKLSEVMEIIDYRGMEALCDYDRGLHDGDNDFNQGKAPKHTEE